MNVAITFLATVEPREGSARLDALAVETAKGRKRGGAVSTLSMTNREQFYGTQRRQGHCPQELIDRK